MNRKYILKIIAAALAALFAVTTGVAAAPSPVSSLVGIKVSAGVLSPDFAVGTSFYTVELPENKPDVTITLTPTNKGAAVYINGEATLTKAFRLETGSQITVNIRVVAEDGKGHSFYTIVIKRAGAAAPPVEPPVEPDAPIDEPDAPIDAPDAPIDAPDEPVDTPDEPIDTPDEPIDTPDEPDVPPVIFTDVKGRWMEPAVSYLAQRCIVTGYPDGTFAPSNIVTRAEFITMLMRTLGINAYIENTKRFPDIHSGEWYETSALQARALGISTGFEDGTFRPDSTITRQDMMTLLARALQFYAMPDWPDTTGVLDAYADKDAIAPYAIDAVSKLVATGVIRGINDTEIQPRGTVTRAQAAQALYNMMTNEMVGIG